MSKWTKWLVVLAWLALAAACGYVSYTTQVELFLMHHEPLARASLMPLAGDALMILAAIKIRERAGMHWRKRVFPTGVMYVGLAFSAFANLATADSHDYVSMVSRGFIAVALWLAVEMLVRPKARVPRKQAETAVERVTKVAEVSLTELRKWAAVAGVKGRSKMAREELELALGLA